MLTCWRDL